MKKVLYYIVATLLLCVLVNVWFWESFQWEMKPYEPYDDEQFVRLYQYSVNCDDQEFLGKQSGDPSKNIYALQGLPQDDFLYITGGLYGGEDIVMAKTAREPIFDYPVKKIEFRLWRDANWATVEDAHVIEQVVSVRKGEEYGIAQPLSSTGSIRFYFDLPCGLVCEYSLCDTYDNKIKMICENSDFDEEREYDLTELLSPWVVYPEESFE
jgi:hypothetical protein